MSTRAAWVATAFLCLWAGSGDAADRFVPQTPSDSRKTASDYYAWRNEQNPVASSDQGLHSWDDRLADYAPSAIQARRQHVSELIALVRGSDAASWSRDDQIDRLLFLAQLEAADFFDRVLERSETDPQLYVNECGNAIFSLLKKEYDLRRKRAASATARLDAMPALLARGKSALTRPYGRYARLAIASARSMDSLFGDSLMTLAIDSAPKERAALVATRDRALAALRDFAAWLEARLPQMPDFVPMGPEKYDWMLRHVYLLPFDARQVAMLGEAELARYRGLEALLADPRMADPDPSRAASIPKDQGDFLAAYEGRQAEMIRFLREKRLVTLPPQLGRFLIRQLPEAFKPTSPGGFMNAPGLYEKDTGGFYFIPTYDPKSPNFYLRAAVEDPRPILGHEGIPGHFLQISIANALSDEIRREHGDGVFVEGWALYTEEMLMRTGLYPEGSAAQGQVLRLSRYRAARIGVDVNLHTGRWSFDQAVDYFREAGGLDRESAEGEAAGAIASPSQKITYMVGKWQILRLLGKYRDRQGDAFRLGAFHDALLANGSLPLSVVEWLLLGDRSSLDSALGPTELAAGEPADAIQRLAWMQGRWAGEKDGVWMEEQWTDPKGGALLGLHRDVKNGRLVSWEFLRIDSAAGGTFYFASPRSAPPTPFKLVDLGRERVVFENAEHDFPQRILYWLDAAGALHARIEGSRQGQRLSDEWVWTKGR